MVDPMPPASATAAGPSSTSGRHLTAVPLRPRHRPGHAGAGALASSELLERVRLEDRELRQWHLRVRTWAMTEGLSLDRDGLTVALAVLLERQRHGGPEISWWTVERVGEMAWSDCAGWAARSGAPLPPGTASALAGFWAYLAAQGSLAPGSDAPEALVEALAAHTDPAGRGSRRKHPSIRKQNVRV